MNRWIHPTPEPTGRGAVALPEGVDIYFGIHPTKGPARIKRGRGKNIDATRLSSLPADLDFSEGKCGSEDTAMAIITELCEILGTPPSAITHSGGGLHPYWVIARPQSGSALGCLDGYDDIDAAVQPAALLARWKRTVKMVAKTHGESGFGVRAGAGTTGAGNLQPQVRQQRSAADTRDLPS